MVQGIAPVCEMQERRWLIADFERKTRIQLPDELGAKAHGIPPRLPR